MPNVPLSPDVVAAYGRALSQSAIFDLSQRGKIELTGDDAVSFLHNLCTNDIQNLADGAVCEAFLTTAKARIVAHVVVYRDGSRLLLDTDAGQAQTLLGHLNHFLVTEQVEMANRTHELAHLHLCGPVAQSVLAKALGSKLDLTALHLQRVAFAGDTLLVGRMDRLALLAYDLICRAGVVEQLRQALVSAGTTLAGLDTYEILRVEAGWPVFGKELDANRFVVEVDRIGQAICYTKGCYLGQEPIVMARDRGQVNRKLMGLMIAGTDPALVGARVFDSEQEVGQVTSSVRSPRLGEIALAYLRRGNWDPGKILEVESTSGRQQAVVRALPF